MESLYTMFDDPVAESEGGVGGCTAESIFDEKSATGC